MIITTVKPQPIALAGIPFRPSDLPAADLPEHEPAAADLEAIEQLGDDEIDDWVLARTVLAAYEQGRLELGRVRLDVELRELVAGSAGEVGCAA